MNTFNIYHFAYPYSNIEQTYILFGNKNYGFLSKFTMQKHLIRQQSFACFLH